MARSVHENPFFVLMVIFLTSRSEGVRQQTWAFLIPTFRDLFISGGFG